MWLFYFLFLIVKAYFLCVFRQVFLLTKNYNLRWMWAYTILTSIKISMRVHPKQIGRLSWEVYDLVVATVGDPQILEVEECRALAHIGELSKLLLLFSSISHDIIGRYIPLSDVKLARCNRSSSIMIMKSTNQNFKLSALWCSRKIFFGLLQI